MSDPGSGAAAAQPPELRIGDAERQSVIDQLRIHTGAGRLTLDEFSERADAAWRAMTASELAPLLADLPAPRPDSRAAAPPWPPPAPSGRAIPGPPDLPVPPAVPVPPVQGAPPPTAATPAGTNAQRSLVAIMSGNHMKGRWEVAPNLSAFAMWGSVRIDLRQAIIRSQVVDIHAAVLMGGIDVIVPEGIPVEVTGMVLMGGSTNRVRSELAMPGAPLIRVHVGGLWGGVNVRSKPNPKAKAESPDEDRHDARTSKQDLKRELQRDIQRSVRDMHREIHRSRYVHPEERRRRGPDHDDEPEEVPTSPLAKPPPDLPEGTLTMLFTDIVGSTASAERLGDQRWAAVLEHHDRTVRTIVAGHGGTVVKGSGDGYLIVFPSARQAVLAAIAIQRAVRSTDGAGPEGPILLRAGLHTGEVVQRDGDVFGRNVIAASRIASQAEAGQVLVSSLTKELVESSGDLFFSDGVEMSLRGLARPWTVHEVHEATA